MSMKDALQKIKLLETQVEYLISIIERFGLNYDRHSNSETETKPTTNS